MKNCFFHSQWAQGGQEMCSLPFCLPLLLAGSSWWGQPFIPVRKRLLSCWGYSPLQGDNWWETSQAMKGEEQEGRVQKNVDMLLGASSSAFCYLPQMLRWFEFVRRKVRVANLEAKSHLVPLWCKVIHVATQPMFSDFAARIVYKIYD